MIDPRAKCFGAELGYAAEDKDLKIYIRNFKIFELCPDGGIGRRARLKIVFPRE